jgi:hypothetical protein
MLDAWKGPRRRILVIIATLYNMTRIALQEGARTGLGACHVYLYYVTPTAKEK